MAAWGCRAAPKVVIALFPSGSYGLRWGAGQKPRSVDRSFGGGKYLYSGIKATVDNIGATVLYETPAKQLVCDPVTHEVYGVIAEDAAGNPVTCKANKGVLLASGCFLGNPDLVDRFIIFREVGLISMGAPTCTGDGLLMGMAAGTAVKNLSLGGLEMCGPARR